MCLASLVSINKIERKKISKLEHMKKRYLIINAGNIEGKIAQRMCKDIFDGKDLIFSFLKERVIRSKKRKKFVCTSQSEFSMRLTILKTHQFS